MEYEATPEDYVESLEHRGFTLSNWLGGGATGRVYRATQSSLGRPVAVKFFDNEFSTRNPLMAKRFARESKLLARVTSPHVPYVLTNGTTRKSKTPYYVMQYVPGDPLDRLLETKRVLAEDVAISYLRQVLLALSAAHKARVIHRDVHPSNVLEHHGLIYLIDFSIGGWIGGSVDTPVATHGPLGRPDYAAPEQQRDGSLADARSDVFSAGVLLFEFLTGHSRVRTEDLLKLLPKARSDVRAAIQRACQEEPGDRFQSADEFRAALPIASASVSHRGVPALAFCNNVPCNGTRWNSKSGTYGGPLIVDGCTDNNCRRCGSVLVYECPGCGSPFEGDQYCGACGMQFFGAPVCKTCGARLNRADVGKETSKGCSSCASWGNYIPGGSTDDDIPF
jgi:serine/threonine protein kinase